MSNWKGTLTTNNIEEVSRRLLELLQGKKFTLVISAPGSAREPRVYTSQVLRKTNPIRIQIGTSWTGLALFFEKNLPAIWTTKAIEEDKSEDKFTNPYVNFFCGEKVTITCRLENKIIYWVFALKR